MVLIILQAQRLIHSFNHININQPVHMTAANNVLIPLEGNINPWNPTGIKLYYQETKNIDKETDKLDNSV